MDALLDGSSQPNSARNEDTIKKIETKEGVVPLSSLFFHVETVGSDTSGRKQRPLTSNRVPKHFKSIGSVHSI